MNAAAEAILEAAVRQHPIVGAVVDTAGGESWFTAAKIDDAPDSPMVVSGARPLGDPMGTVGPANLGEARREHVWLFFEEGGRAVVLRCLLKARSYTIADTGKEWSLTVLPAGGAR